LQIDFLLVFHIWIYSVLLRVIPSIIFLYLHSLLLFNSSPSFSLSSFLFSSPSLSLPLPLSLSLFLFPFSPLPNCSFQC
jgi:hypothetical protein